MAGSVLPFVQLHDCNTTFNQNLMECYYCNLPCTFIKVASKLHSMETWYSVHFWNMAWFSLTCGSIQGIFYVYVCIYILASYLGL